MPESLILLITFVVLPVIMLFAFTGCVGEDPELVAAKEKAEEEKEKAEQEKKELEKQIEADKEEARYHNVIKADPFLVSYWRLDEPETGGVTAKDSAPDDPRDGEYKFLQGISRGEKGALALVNDLTDKAAEFHGTQGFVEVPYHGLLNPPLSFSVEAWVKPEGPLTDPQVVLGSYEIDATGSVVRGFVIDVLPGPTPRVRARLGNENGSTSLEADLGAGEQHEGWRHVVMTYSVAMKELKLYVNAADGKPDSQLPTPQAPSPVLYKWVADTAMPLRIAAGQPGVPPPPPGTVGLFFNGRLDEVALYRGALDGSTIRKHFLAATAAGQ